MKKYLFISLIGLILTIPCFAGATDARFIRVTASNDYTVPMPDTGIIRGQVMRISWADNQNKYGVPTKYYKVYLIGDSQTVNNPYSISRDQIMGDPNLGASVDWATYFVYQNGTKMTTPLDSYTVQVCDASDVASCVTSSAKIIVSTSTPLINVIAPYGTYRDTDLTLNNSYRIMWDSGLGLSNSSVPTSIQIKVKNANDSSVKNIVSGIKGTVYDWNVGRVTDGSVLGLGSYQLRVCITYNSKPYCSDWKNIAIKTSKIEITSDLSNLVFGATTSIAWTDDTAQAPSSPYKIFMEDQNSSQSGLIAFNISGRSVMWPVGYFTLRNNGNRISTSGDYKIKVCSMPYTNTAYLNNCSNWKNIVIPQPVPRYIIIDQPETHYNNLTIGNTQNIAWTESPYEAGTSYDIKARMANSSVPSASFTIAKSITGTNYSWTVGKAVDYTGATVTLPLGPSYDLVVCRSDNTMCTGSPKQFTLTPAPTATFQVLSTIPSKLALGAVVDITWSDSDTTATNYHLLLRTPTGKQYWIFVGPPTSVSADGVRHYSWTAGTVVNNIQANPTMPTFPGSYFITVCHAYAGKCVYSNTFSVSSNSSAVNKKINQLAVINRALEKLLLLLKN